MSARNRRALQWLTLLGGAGKSLYSSPGQVAQLVEHVTENHGVGGSTPPLAIRYFTDLCAARYRRFGRIVRVLSVFASRWA